MSNGYDYMQLVFVSTRLLVIEFVSTRLLVIESTWILKNHDRSSPTFYCIHPYFIKKNLNTVV